MKHYDLIKRTLDVAVALPGLVLSLPVQAGVAVLVKVKLGSPVLFAQIRPGKNEQPFTMIKFRSMLNQDPTQGLVDDRSRMTPLGRWLRSTSLDELPTLWNVVRGDMSLVGPRPLLMQYLKLYDEKQARRHEVRPGLTGLAQVAGRNTIDWETKLRLDVDYVDQRSISLDFQILWRTVAVVLRREGVSSHGSPTMQEFEGRGSS